jgi:hypothetical protein
MYFSSPIWMLDAEIVGSTTVLKTCRISMLLVVLKAGYGMSDIVCKRTYSAFFYSGVHHLLNIEECFSYYLTRLILLHGP